MALLDLPVFQALKGKMAWHQQRQHVLAENIANSDTPRFRTRDLEDYSFGDELAMSKGSISTAVTNPGHISGTFHASSNDVENPNTFEITPDDNNVSLEEQMMKVTQNQLDYQAVTTLYRKSLGLIKTAVSSSS